VTDILALGAQPLEVLAIAGVLLVVALFAGLLVMLLIRGVRKFQREYEGRLRTFADELGLTFHEKTGPWYKSTPAHVTGTFRDRQVKLDHYTVSHGKSSTTYMRLVAGPVDCGEASVRICAENFLTKLGKMVGLEDINVDDGWFDEKYLIRGSSPDFARAALGDPEAREKISAVVDKSRGEIAIEKGQARWRAIGFGHEPRLLAVTLDALCDMADGAEGREEI